MDSVWRRIFKDSDLSESDLYFMNLCVSFLLLVVVVFVADLAARTMYEDPDSLSTVQGFEAWAVATVQREVLGVEVEADGKYIDYDSGQVYHGYSLTREERVGDFVFEVSSTCSGLHEMVFLSVLVGGFPGAGGVGKRLKWAGIMAGLMFVENLFRMGILFFFAWMISRDFEGKFHYHFWKYGQYMVMMSFFMIWFYFVAWKDLDRKMGGTAAGKDDAGDAVNVNP